MKRERAICPTGKGSDEHDRKGISRPALSAGIAATAGFFHTDSPAQEQEWNELFLRDQEAFELRLHRHPTPELLALALYLRWAVATYRRYLTLGIPEAVFWDTFQDFALWSEECMRVTGQPGLIEWGWNALLLHMELFRLGRLEYQPRTLQQDIVFGEVSLAAGTPILEVHIPAARRFASVNCQLLYAQPGLFLSGTFSAAFSGSTVIPGCYHPLYEICFPLHRESFNSSVFLPFTVKIFHSRRQSNAFSGVYRQTHSGIPSTPACSGP